MTIPQIEFSPVAQKNIGIEIIELSDLYLRFENSKNNIASKPHRINFHNLIYITEGSGKHFIDFNTYTLQAGSVVFINKNQIHAFDLNNRPQGKLINFNDEYLGSMLTTIKTPIFAPTHLLASYAPSFVLNNSLRDTCDAILAEIKKEYALPQSNLAFIRLLFSALLSKLTTVRPDIYNKHLSESRTSTFVNFIRLLETNFTTLRNANTYAQMLNTTYKSLNHVCKLATNQTAKQLIDAHTILEAKRKLCVEQIRIQQLAEIMGFDEVTNFVKYFKKHTSLTPSQFKKSIQG